MYTYIEGWHLLKTWHRSQQWDRADRSLKYQKKQGRKKRLCPMRHPIEKARSARLSISMVDIETEKEN